MSIYLDLTKEFNQGKLRAIITSGQAVVLHRLAIMSKDGDWILREDDETLRFVLQVLQKHGAAYRFGAPLDIRWMSGGWSSHLEFRSDALRVRTDFFTRPPRLTENTLDELWEETKTQDIPFVNAKLLADMKKTNREKDYAVIGELARAMTDPADQLLYSRSARDIIALSEKHPELVQKLINKRVLLSSVEKGREDLEVALDAERRELIHQNEVRLERYERASKDWAKYWPEVSKKTANKTLADAHDIIVAEAEKNLPFTV